jgi:chromosome segregation ATPase
MVEDATMRILQQIQREITGIRLKIDDLQEGSHRIEAELGALRGSVAALRHNTKIYSDRWADHEVRLRALEQEEST